MDLTLNHGPITELMQHGLRAKVFPGAVLLVGRGDRSVYFEAFGTANLFTRAPMARETVNDLASLTKPLATTLAVAKLVDRGDVGFDQPVERWLPALSGSDKSAITIRQLLGHQSGFPAHDLMYMTHRSVAPKKRKSAALGLLKRIPLVYPPGRRVLYSDLGFMLLRQLVESVAGCTLDRFLNDEIFGPSGLNDLFFVDLNSGQRPCRAYAATELCPHRNRLLNGEVHDDNAWWGGGIDGHAGLFGTADAVFKLMRLLARDYHGGHPKAILSSGTLNEVFHGNAENPFPLGFDRPAKYNSSAGCHFSANTVGHLGFTGVSFWMDLDADITVVLLTNRVHPFRWNSQLQHFRPRIHDRIMEQFDIYSD